MKERNKELWYQACGRCLKKILPTEELRGQIINSVNYSLDIKFFDGRKIESIYINLAADEDLYSNDHGVSAVIGKDDVKNPKIWGHVRCCKHLMKEFFIGGDKQ